MPAKESVGSINHERLKEVPKNLGAEGKVVYSFTSVSVARDVRHSHTRTFPHRRLIRKMCLK